MTKLKRALVAVFYVIFFVIILRGAVELMHPKDGLVTSVTHSIFGDNAMYWTVINISSPSYNFLINNIWSNPLIFGLLVVEVLILGWVMSKSKQPKQSVPNKLINKDIKS